MVEYTEKDRKLFLKRGFRVLRSLNDPPRLDLLIDVNTWSRFERFNTIPERDKRLEKLLLDYKTLFHP